jgi:hypothetical protein
VAFVADIFSFYAHALWLKRKMAKWAWIINQEEVRQGFFGGLKVLFAVLISTLPNSLINSSFRVQTLHKNVKYVLLQQM